MSPYEVLQPAGRSSTRTTRRARCGLKRVLESTQGVWLIPSGGDLALRSRSHTREIMGGRSIPPTIQGLERAMRALVR